MAYFTLYLYRFESTAGHLAVTQLLKEYEGKVGVTFFNFEDESNEEKIRKINGIILSERSRRYSDECLYDMYITVVEFSKDRFLVIVSALADYYTSEDIVKKFKSVNIDPTVEYFNGRKSSEDSAYFWKCVLSEFSMAGKKDLTKQLKRDSEIAIPLKLKNMADFDRLLKNSPQQAKVLLSAAVARIMCIINDSAGLIFEDVHEGGRLGKVPVRISDGVGTKQGREELYDYFRKADLNDCVDYDVIRSKTGIDLYNCALFSQSFVCGSSYSDYFVKMKVATIYKIKALNLGNVPLFVTYRMHEEEKNIQYEYSSVFFDGIDIEGFHEAVGLLVDSYLANEVEPSVEKLLHRPSNLARKIEEIKVKCIKSIPMFEEFTDAEIDEFANKAEFKQYFCQQNVIEKNTSVDKIYIVLMGRLQVNGEDMEGISKPLYFLKEKDIFGLESMGEKTSSNANYSVYSDQCILIAIKAEDILKKAVTHRKMLSGLFEEQSKLLHKFQRLWMLS